MKQFLITAVAAMAIGFSAVALAGDRGYYGYRHHDRHAVVVHKRYQHDRHYHGRKYHDRHYYGRKYHDHKHWKRYDRHHRYYHPRHRGGRYVIRHEYDDDFYKWMGGLYILNEVLHHHHR